MNERIRKLALQAGLDLIHDKFMTAPQEKFAELIVRDCADVCYHHSWAAGGEDTAFGYGYKDCGDDVKQHFGVEL